TAILTNITIGISSSVILETPVNQVILLSPLRCTSTRGWMQRCKSLFLLFIYVPVMRIPAAVNEYPDHPLYRYELWTSKAQGLRVSATIEQTSARST
ncbi:MAG: hypothetical protein OEY37_11390, partial [Gammaproteobacteria bacterium]|nr:hypothetical protein [Gammaproteobacteria bacterium]